MGKAIEVENLSKAYQIGEFTTGTLSHDLERWWALARGKEDPFLKIGEINVRSSKGESNVVWSLKDLNFEVEQGEAIGIIGKNGAGKSTLLKVLSQITTPTSGTVKMKGRVASLLEVGTGFHPELTGRENIYLNGAILGMQKSEVRRKFDEIVDFSGVERYIDTPVKRYSSGMYVRLAFAVAAHLDSEILIVDEVLAVGDAEFQKKCLGKMGDITSGEGRTILFVSHMMNSVRALCPKSYLLRDGQITFQGESTQAINLYLSEKWKSQDGSDHIPPEFSEYSTGEAKFKKLALCNSKNEPKQKFFFGEELQIIFDLEVFENLSSVSIALLLVNNFGETIFINPLDNSFSSNSFDVNTYRFTVKMNEILMPGEYYLTLSISQFGSGSSIDYVPMIRKIEILRESVSDVDGYPWATIHGYSSPKADWKIKIL
jgi:lipopolysaccharide transport system ATP-binding protein